MNLKDVRELIANRSVDFLRTTSGNNVRNLIFSTFTGSGKSTTVLKEIDDRGYLYIYLAPFHDIIIENIEFSKLKNYNILHLESRARICRIREYKQYAKMGLSIEPFCETRCPYRDNGCPYYERLRDIYDFPQCWAGVHAHIPTLLQEYLFSNYEGRTMFNLFDVLVIDEFPTTSFYDTLFVNTRDLEFARSVLHQCNISTPVSRFINMFLEDLLLGAGGVPINHGRLYRLIHDTQGLDFDEFFAQYNDALLRLVSNETINTAPKNILFKIRKIYENGPSREILEWMVYKHVSKGWNESGLYLSTSNVEYFRNLPLPVIGLDATANNVVWNNLLGGNCEFEKIDMEYRNVYQLNTGRYPVSYSWVNINEEGKKELGKSGERLCELIYEICKWKKQDVLICATKRVMSYVETYLKDRDIVNYMFGNFYNLRSRNQFYEDCDTCVIAHLPSPPPLQVNILTNITGWDEEIIRELYSTDEIKQAIGRIRQNIRTTPSNRKRKRIDVFILTNNATVEERKARKIVEEADLISYKNLLYSIKHGKIICDTEDVIRDIIERKGTTSRKDIAETYKIQGYALKNILNNLKHDGYIFYEPYKGIKWKGYPEKYVRK